MNLTRPRLAWCLYDFANSIYVAVIPATIWQVYFINVVVGNATGQGDLWWGRSIAVSMALVAVTSPWLGSLADGRSMRRRLFTFYTLAAVLGTAALSFASTGTVLWGFAFTVLATVGFEGAMVFYNAYLPELAPPESRGRLSGWAFAAGYAGSALGLLGIMPLVKREWYAASFLCVAGSFLVFALLALLWLPRDSGTRSPVNFAQSLRDTWSTAVELFMQPNLRWFLVAYFLYIDGVETVILFSSSFASHTLGFAMSDLILLYLVVQVAALVGSLSWALPTDRLGPRRVILIMLAQWLVVVVAAFLVQERWQFYLVAILAGSGLGAIQSASRTYLALAVPPGHEARYFGFFNLCGRSAAILGPIMFGLVSSLTHGQQRVSILSVLLLLAFGSVFMLQTHEHPVRPAL